MSRLRLALVVAGMAVLVAPGSALASFDAAARPTAAKTVQISTPDAGDVTLARVTYTAAKRQAKNPTLTVANGASLGADVRVLASIRPLNSKRRTFEALVVVVSPPADGLPARAARPAGGGPIVVLRANATGKLKAKLDQAVDVFGNGILDFVCEKYVLPHALALVAGDEIPEIDSAFGEKLCDSDPATVTFLRGPLAAEGAVGDDHLGPGSSLFNGSFTTAAGALVTWSSTAQSGQSSYRALRLFGEDDFQSDPLSTACLAVPISTFGSRSFTWQSSLYGQTASVTRPLNVTATEVPLPGCVTTGDVTSVEPWACFGPSGRGYIGKTIKGVPGSRFSVELTSPVADMFYGTDTALVTGTIPDDGEIYTGANVKFRGLIEVRLFDGGSSSVTMTVDTTDELPAASEEAEPVCDVM